VEAARENYAWSWALCHFLYHHPNYTGRFRALGHGFLCNREDTLLRAFETRTGEMEYEFRFFLQHVDVGYRIDLCRWNWAQPVTEAQGRRGVSIRLLAARGFQSTRLQLQRGQKCAYATAGNWSTSPHRPSTDADGDGKGCGQLEGVLLDGYSLSESFGLGSSGTLVSPADGVLHLRCRDAWNELADNRGVVSVQLQPE
jgi:hypothetical protein